jgi:hypothetical protein
MARTVIACLVALVLLPSVVTATSPGAAGRPAVHQHVLDVSRGGLPFLEASLDPRSGLAAGAMRSVAPVGAVHAFMSHPANIVSRCGGELAFSPDAQCARGCDASKDACDGKCSIGLSSCLAQCPILGFACDAYCRAAVIVCRGSCARAHGACVDRCPQRGGRESKRIVPNSILGQ